MLGWRRLGARHRWPVADYREKVTTARNPQGAASQSPVGPKPVAKAYGEMYLPTNMSRALDGLWMLRSDCVSVPPLAAHVRLATGMRRAGLTLSERQSAISDGPQA